MFRLVEFPSEGVTLRGRLYLPADQATLLPIVIMAYGFSATINGMVADNYAERFYGAGFAVLLYDHYSLGISDGEPRQQLNRWVQTRGYLDAIDFVTTLPEIDADRIALWGDSMSGGEVIVAGAIDARVKAILAQVPACGAAPPPPDPDGQLFASLRDILLQGNINSLPQTIGKPLPVVSYDQLNNPSMLLPLTAFRWFMEYGSRYGTNWENWGTRVAPDVSTPFHPALCTPHLQAPLQMLISYEDEIRGANSDVARLVFELASGPKELIEMDGGHFGLVYYPSELFEQASAAQKEFLKKYL